LAFSLFANHEANKQLDVLAETTKHIKVTGCTFRSPNIVLIIGESYNKHHSQLYGYEMPTTKYQLRLARQGSLVPFSDVIAPWNLTSYVFKMMLSTYTVGDKGEWCDYPLFPQLFRKAGYHVSFITNQFQSRANEQVYDFSGGFFLNNPEVSQSMFDTRNTSLHRYDDGVLEDYDHLKSQNTAHNLIILHLMGQHVMYKERYPDEHKLLGPQDYTHRPICMHDRYVLADYDNATRYNDSIVYAAIQRFARQDAIVIYMPDHGEEAFGDNLHVYGRQHTSNIDWRLAKEEFQIPFWIWCSPSYARKHPDVVAAIRAAKDKPFMTDRIAHTLLWLGGISTPVYKASANILSNEYDSKRPRYIKREVNYDELKKNHKPQKSSDE
jgi:heptose-I-phosphate ethanolaminephosphotransferase